jgi:hypothetical protein
MDPRSQREGVVHRVQSVWPGRLCSTPAGRLAGFVLRAGVRSSAGSARWPCGVPVGECITDTATPSGRGSPVPRTRVSSRRGVRAGGFGAQGGGDKRPWEAGTAGAESPALSLGQPRRCSL